MDKKPSSETLYHATGYNINALGWGHTHTHTDMQTKAISRNQEHVGCTPGLKTKNSKFNVHTRKYSDIKIM